MKKIVAGVLLVTTLLFAVSCGKKCEACGKMSSKGEELFGVFVCQNCIDELNSAFAGF